MPYIEKLKMIKTEKGLSNAEIARVCNVPLATITRVFSERTLNPTFETIVDIAIGMGVSLDELVGLKQPDEPPIPSPIETTINSYAELLKEKDVRIDELKNERDQIRKEKNRLFGLLACFVAFVLVILTVDILNGHFGYFRS